MARFDFRHGIARRQQDGSGNPNNLQPSNGGSYVDLIVSPDPTVFCISHYDADYMFTENASIVKAWGPFTSGTDYWLYWDVDFITGELTRGYTTLDPQTGPNPPPQVVDQHWYDINNKVIRVWNGASWSEKIRLFAAQYQSGAILIYEPLGSQVGLNNVETKAGKPLFDPDNNPLQKFQRNRRGQFITTETDLHSQFSRIANFRVEAAVVQGTAQEHIPMNHAVALSGYDELKLSRNTVDNLPAIGLATEDMYTGEVRTYITKGFVTDEVNWNWTAPAGAPLFVGATGELVTTPPNSVSLQNVGYIVNKNTVFVDISAHIVLNPPTGNLTPIMVDRTTGKIATRPNSNTIVDLDLDDLGDVTLTNPQDGEALVFDFNTGEWVNDVVSGGSTPPAGFYQVWGYTHEEPTPDYFWTIEHNLNTERVLLEVYDATGSEVFPNNVTILDSNTVMVDFGSPQDGKAHLMLLV